MPARDRQKTRLAQHFRQQPTFAEELAWKHLKFLSCPRFRRQAPVGPYVLDFYAPRWKIGIELDGPFHEPEEDAKRDAWLAKKGIRIFRYPSESFNPDVILRELAELIDEPLS